MRTGTGNRTNYNRTTGSRTARLYSKRTARNINRIYQKTQEEERRRNSQGYHRDRQDADRRRNSQSRYREREYEYNDYYDNPRSTRKSAKSKSTPVIIATIVVVILAVVFVVLALMKPAAPTVTTVTETTGGEVLAETPEETGVFEESDPPVIYGIIPIVVYEGHSVAYKQGIYVEDDTDPYPTLEIDNEYVDLSTPGTYIVSYIARDKDGNVTREATSVTVLEGTNMVSDEEIYALADSILDVIVNDYMTESEKCLHVYEYLHAIGYVDEVHSEDWMQNAYWMLQLREGDCFCYYSAARLLLTRLGYEVMEVQNNNNYTHYWCLVSIDGGQTWWHFDATQWVWGEDGILCLVSDDYLSEFTRRHKTSDGRLIHAWDRTNYPATPLYDFWTDEDRSIIYDGEYLNYLQDNTAYDPLNPTGYGYDTQYVDPSLYGMDPAAYGLQPGYGDPAAGYVDPATGYVDPAAGYVDPATGYVDPAAGYVDPAAGYVDPAAGYGYDTTYGNSTGYGYDTTYNAQTGYGYDTTYGIQPDYTGQTGDTDPAAALNYYDPAAAQY